MADADSGADSSWLRQHDRGSSGPVILSHRCSAVLLFCSEEFEKACENQSDDRSCISIRACTLFLKALPCRRIHVAGIRRILRLNACGSNCRAERRRVDSRPNQAKGEIHLAVAPSSRNCHYYSTTPQQLAAPALHCACHVLYMMTGFCPIPPWSHFTAPRQSAFHQIGRVPRLGATSFCARFVLRTRGPQGNAFH